MFHKPPTASWREKLEPSEITRRFKSETNLAGKSTPKSSVSAMEISVAVQKLVAGGMSPEEAAAEFGRRKNWAEAHLRLQKLPKDVQELFGPSHAPGKRLVYEDAHDIFRKKFPEDQRVLAREYFAARQNHRGGQIWKGVDPDSQVPEAASRGTRLLHRAVPFNAGRVKKRPRPPS
jgi:hypothetical protein